MEHWQSFIVVEIGFALHRAEQLTSLFVVRHLFLPTELGIIKSASL